MDLVERLRGLEADRSSGAVTLAREVLQIAQEWVRAGREPAELATRLRSMHPAIAAVANVGRAVEEGDDLAELQISLENGNLRIAERLGRRIPPGRAILTISNSSTVLEALATTLQPRLVLALVSEPGGEGAALAEELAARGIPARLEPDAAMGRLIAEEADLALVGVDSFDSDGNLIHKAGTLPLALCCRWCDKAFRAAGHSIKRVRGSLTQQPTDERFDLTPSELITEIVTER